MEIATGLIRRHWVDCLSAVPPIIIILAFKFYLTRTAEAQFKYFIPTPEEIERERHIALNRDRTHHSEMEKSFLHPALQEDELYTVMVHKSQERLARELLSAYGSSGKGEEEGIVIKAVGEVCHIFTCAAGWSRADGFVGGARVRSNG
jgi:hypothetical protein